MRRVSLFIRLLVLALPLAIVLWLVPLFWFDHWSQWRSGASVATGLSIWVLVTLGFVAITRWPPGQWVDSREEGVVKWFNGTKGFGFITRDNDEDVFVHFRSIRGRGHRTLHEGQRVRFGVVDSEKGLQAEDVSVIRQD
jgi:CspA family cold shock protein